MGENDEEAGAHLLVVVGHEEKAGKGLSGVEQISGEEELGSGDIPVRKRE